MAKEENVNLNEFHGEIIRSREEWVHQNLEKGLTAHGYKRRRFEIKEVPLVDIFVLMMKGKDYKEIAKKLNVGKYQLKQLARSKEFRESYQAFIIDSAERAKIFADYRERESIKSFVDLVDVRNRFIDAEDVKKVRLAMSAAESLSDRSASTQKTSRIQEETRETFVLTAEAAALIEKVLEQERVFLLSREKNVSNSNKHSWLNKHHSGEAS